MSAANSGAVMGIGAAATISAKFSQLAGALLGNKSIFMPVGNQALTPFFIDDTVYILQSNGVTTPPFQGKLQFNLPKNSTLIGKAYVEITLTGGKDNSTQNAAATDGYANSFDPNLAYSSAGTYPTNTNMPLCEYVKNVGDLIVDQHQLVYGNANLQQFPGLFHYLFRRVCRNDVNIEATNAQVLGNLPPGKFLLLFACCTVFVPQSSFGVGVLLVVVHSLPRFVSFVLIIQFLNGGNGKTSGCTQHYTFQRRKLRKPN